ncbi:MAG: VOC family protein [Streptosporangiales bacterium]|nr:VOC family protein [Streptosporangiales bacterium]
MARVTGIGGFFFRAREPEELVRWYATHLGVAPPPSHDGDPYWWQQAGPTVWAPMPADGDDIGGRDGWMLNFRVDDLDGMLEHFAEAGIEIERGVEEYEYGRFVWLRDPENNPLELWEPSPQRLREP